MNIEKAMAALRRGDMVTRLAWKKGVAVCIKDDKICHHDKGDPAFFNSQDLLAEDWDLVVELVPFAQALQALLAGKRAARRPWMGLDLRRYIIHSGPVGSSAARVLLASDDGGRRSVGPWDAASTDILANDWVILD